MLAGVCLRSTSLCYSMRCRGKVSEEALHVGSGCEAFHLETNAFPVQWAFSLSLSGICVCTCVSEKEERDNTESETERACVCVCVNIDLDLTEIQEEGVEVCMNPDCIYGCICILARTPSATGNQPQCYLQYSFSTLKELPWLSLCNISIL